MEEFEYELNEFGNLSIEDLNLLDKHTKLYEKEEFETVNLNIE
jgi:hypothetical protein